MILWRKALKSFRSTLIRSNKRMYEANTLDFRRKKTKRKGKRVWYLCLGRRCDERRRCEFFDCSSSDELRILSLLWCDFEFDLSFPLLLKSFVIAWVSSSFDDDSALELRRWSLMMMIPWNLWKLLPLFCEFELFLWNWEEIWCFCDASDSVRVWIWWRLKDFERFYGGLCFWKFS
jgi:hypothetical protein